MSKTRRWLVLAVVSAGLLMVSVDTTVLYTALPTLTHDLHADAAQKLWIINAYPLVMAGLLLGTGTLGDRIGHKRMYLTGLALFASASLLAAFAPSAVVLIAGQAFLAVGAAAMLPATLALIRTTFDDERERGLAIGVWGTMAAVGAALGPIACAACCSSTSGGARSSSSTSRSCCSRCPRRSLSCPAARATATAPGT